MIEEREAGKDASLDRLLTGLGSATPDEGFEQRVVHGVRARVETVSTESMVSRMLKRLGVEERGESAGALHSEGVPQRLKPRMLSQAYGTTETVPSWSRPRFQPVSALAVGLVFAVALTVVTGIRRPREEGRPVLVARAGQPAARPNTAEGIVVGEAATSPRTARRPATQHEVGEPTAARVAAAEADPARVASFPAPPAPLTEQEKLLLKIAHTGDPEEFAGLNPEQRASEEQADEEAYLEFFPPPPSPEKEQELILKIAKGEKQ